MKAPHGQLRPSPFYLVSRAQACITGRDFSACSFTPEPAKPVPPCRRRGCHEGSLAAEVRLGPGPWLDEGGAKIKGRGICVSEVIDISPGKLDSSLCFIQPSVSHEYSA